MSHFHKLCLLALLVGLTFWACSSDEEKKVAHFENGVAYFREGKFKSARLGFENALQIDAKYIEALEFLGKTYLKLGDARRAFRVYVKVAELEPDNIEAQIKLATFHWLAQNHGKSRKAVDAILTMDPANIEGLLLHGGLLGQEEDLAGAASAFEKVIELDGKEIRGYLGLAHVRSAQGRAGDAEKILQEAVQIDSQAEITWRELFRFYQTEQKFALAEGVLKDAMAANPESSDLSIELGNFYFSRQDRQAAEAAYLRAIDLAPDRTKPYLALAGFLDAVGSEDRALAIYQKALELKPDDPRLIDTIAGYHLKLKNFEEVERYVNASLKKRPGYFPMRLLKAELLTLRKKFNEAIGMLDSLIKEEPGSARAHYVSGLAHMGKGDINTAKADISRAVELSRRFAKARLLLAELHFREREYKWAQKEAQEVLAIFPNDYKATLIVGNAYLYQGRLAEAGDIYESLIQLDPENPAGYFRLGLVQRIQRKYAPALANFEKALTLRPDFMDALTNITRIYIARNEPDQAIIRCDRYLKDMGGEPEIAARVYHLKGQIYIARENRAEAKKSYTMAIEKDPNYLASYYMLARVFFLDEAQDRVIAQYEAILEKDPNQAIPHMMLGIIYEMQQNYDLAENHYRLALETDPELAAAANNLAYILADRNKNLQEALSLAQIAKEKLPDSPFAMDTLGWAYYKKGFYDLALVEIADSLEKVPENPTVIYHLGMIHYQKGEPEKARAALEKALRLNEKFPEADKARKMLAEIDG